MTDLQKVRCFVLSVLPYKMVDENSGEVNQGISADYVSFSSLYPSEEADPSTGQKGVKPFKQVFPLGFQNKITAVPAVYDISFATRPVKGKPMLSPVDIDYVGFIEPVLNEVSKGKKG